VNLKGILKMAGNRFGFGRQEIRRPSITKKQAEQAEREAQEAETSGHNKWLDSERARRSVPRRERNRRTR
jgi:hypothetical protein